MKTKIIIACCLFFTILLLCNCTTKITNQKRINPYDLSLPYGSSWSPSEHDSLVFQSTNMETKIFVTEYGDGLNDEEDTRWASSEDNINIYTRHISFFEEGNNKVLNLYIRTTVGEYAFYIFYHIYDVAQQKVLLRGGFKQDALEHYNSLYDYEITEELKNFSCNLYQEYEEYDKEKNTFTIKTTDDIVGYYDNSKDGLMAFKDENGTLWTLVSKKRFSE